ncbi:MAG: hypothetical protein QW328_06255 [Nitrososphaerota archaeon]
MVACDAWKQTFPAAPGTHTVQITSGSDVTDILKEFTGSGSLNDFTAPVIIDPITSQAFQLKSGPQVWSEVTYTVTNKDNYGYYYMSLP